MIGGVPGGNIGEPLNAPMTAHFVGGAVISESAATGVIDPYQRVHGYPTLHVVDGAAVTANLGVNPSLTITAQAERALAMWPNKGEEDPRPDQGQEYRRLPPCRRGARWCPRRPRRLAAAGSSRHAQGAQLGPAGTIWASRRAQDERTERH